MKQAFDVAVVGGGLAGLSAAAYLGRAGLSVVVVEKGKELGGRARTTVEEGFSLNLGAHAVYRNGPAWSVLDELKVPVVGGIPKGSGTLAIAKTGVHAMPVGLVSLITTGLLPLAGKLEVSRLLASLGGVDTAPLMGMPALEWVERALATEEARGFLKSFLRLATYTGDLERLSAGAAIAQLQHAVKHNVVYLDGGWQVLVDTLRERATAAGATIVTGDGVAQVEAHAPERTTSGQHAATSAERRRAVRVTLHDGGTLEARAALLAVGPRAAAAMVPSSRALAQIADRAVPVKVSTLDVALSRLPRPRVKVAFGTERPLYFSVHSAVARLGPEGGAVVHVMRYGEGGDARATEQELEEVMDRLQPGWRDVVVHRRFLPAMVAANDLVAAERGGLAGRPDVAVPDTPGLFIAGDWVGKEGMLLDAALASAKQAAMECAAALAVEGRSEGGGAHARRDTRHELTAPARTAVA